MSIQTFDLRVACHTGHRGELEPRRFWLGERAVTVTEIVDRWLAPELRYFKIRGDDAHTYILRHDTHENRWELTLFDRGPRSQ